MRVYAETSWWLGYKCRRDTQHDAALSFFEREPEAQVLWTAWQRVEVFNGFARRSGRACFAKENPARSSACSNKRSGLAIGRMWSSTGDAVRTAGEL